MTTLDGLTALVTGAARGMGEAEARLLAQHGARVVLTDIDAELGRAVADDIGEAAIFVEHDVSSEESWAGAIAAATDAFGRVDVLVNNAGISLARKLIDTEPDDFDRLYAVNQRGVYLGMKAVVGPMRAVGGGAIVNLASVAGLQGTSTLFGYSATKWAVRGMTKSAALELARFEIRVNAVCPGVIDTPMNDANPPGMNDVLIKTTPLRRMGSATEIADAVLYLVSPAAAFVTGTEIVVDGGMSI